MSMPPSVSATRHFQPFPCPNCRDGMVRAAGAEKCKQCLKYAADEQKALDDINRMDRANRRSGV